MITALLEDHRLAALEFQGFQRDCFFTQRPGGEDFHPLLVCWQTQGQGSGIPAEVQSDQNALLATGSLVDKAVTISLFDYFKITLLQYKVFSPQGD